MEILRTNAVASIKAQVEKGINALALYMTLPVEALSTEKISIFIERNDKNNIQITQGAVDLKTFILATTYGTDAITSFQAGLGEAFESVCLIELCEDGAFPLEANEKIKIELTGLDVSKVYVLDGIEAPMLSDDVYIYEEKVISSESKVSDVNVHMYDIMVIQDDANIDRIQLTYDNGKTCDFTRREMRVIAQDIDPIAYVKKDGKAFPGFIGLIQFPLKGVKTMTVRKSEGTAVKVFLRQDLDLKSILY